MIWVSLLELGEAIADEPLPIINLVTLIEAGDILHSRTLIEYQTAWKNVWFVNVVRHMARIATVLDVSLPEGRTQVLRCAADGCHGAHSTVILVFKVVLWLSEVDDFDLMRLRKQEKVCWFQISMADAHGLEVAQSWDDADDHLLQLLLIPECTCGFSLAKHVLKISSTIHVFAYHGDAVRVIHCLVKVVSKELKNVRMTLYFE